MDAFDIALLMANQHADGPMRMRYGTVVGACDESVLSVVPDGQESPVPAVTCCLPVEGSRVVLLVNGTEWLAAAVVGGDCPYGVGDLWITLSSDDPRNRWRGTAWERVLDRMLLASGKRDVAETGGEEEHTHWLPIGDEPGLGYLSATTSLHHRDVNVPHQIHAENSWIEAGITSQTCSYEASSMPPYLVAHMWKRIA